MIELCCLRHPRFPPRPAGSKPCCRLPAAHRTNQHWGGESSRSWPRDDLRMRELCGCPATSVPSSREVLRLCAVQALCLERLCAVQAVGVRSQSDRRRGAPDKHPGAPAWSPAPYQQRGFPSCARTVYTCDGPPLMPPLKLPRCRDRRPSRFALAQENFGTKIWLCGKDTPRYSYICFWTCQKTGACHVCPRGRQNTSQKKALCTRYRNGLMPKTSEKGGKGTRDGMRSCHSSHRGLPDTVLFLNDDRPRV